MDEQLLQQLKESVDKLQPYLELMSINTSPVPYTIWTLAVSIFAALFGAIGAYYGWRAYHYSKRISNNVATIKRYATTVKVDNIACCCVFKHNYACA